MSVRICAAACVVLLGGTAAYGQQLEPRVYLPSPVGSNVVIVAASTSRGDVLFDPSLPVEDARARIGSLAFGYYRSFDLLGRSANVGLAFPLLRGSMSGLLAGQPQRVDRLGQGDTIARLTVNLVGSPAMDMATLVKRGRRTNFGASLVVSVPTGQYDSSKYINIGAHRWAYKPELGLSIPFARRWLLDIYAGVWLFTDNAQFVGGRYEQSPLFTSQFHLSYNLSPRAWAAVNATFYSGGRSTVGEVANLERFRNTRLGGTVSLPLARRQSLKFAVSTGAWVRLGGDFTTFSVSWNYAWGRGF
jgi:hypothetical protein